MGAVTGGHGSDRDVGAMSEINVTPLVDVVLVLLIMFMLIIPKVMASAHVKVDLPETSSIAVAPEKMPLVFSLVLEQGTTVLYLNAQRTDEAAIRKTIQNFGVPIEELRAALSADRGISYGEVVRVVDMLRTMGISKVSLDTRHVEGQ
jgi:biopolymer transport protein ExbD